MRDLGYKSTWQQCKTKVKNLTQRYRKVSHLYTYTYIHIYIYMYVTQVTISKKGISFNQVTHYISIT